MKSALEKLQELKYKLYQAEREESEKLSRRGWGYAQRHVKIGFSTRKTDALKERIEELEKNINQKKQNQQS